MSYDADAQTYFTAVEAVSDFDLTAIEAWLTPSYVKGHIDRYVRGLKTDAVWSAMLNSCLWIGPRTIEGAFVKLRGTAVCSITVGTVSYDPTTGVTTTASNSRITTSQDVGGIQNNIHCAVWIHNDYVRNNGRYLDGGGTREILGGSGDFVRFRADASIVTSVASPVYANNLTGFSRNNSADYQFVVGINSGSVNQTSVGGFTGNIQLFGDGADVGTGQTMSMFSTGTATDLTKIRDRFSELKSALSTFTPLSSLRRNNAFIGLAF